tara:strand:- start:1071 stop:2750 length:1680 start_codon:yes stop_codon:yes gene_type:complete
MAERHPNDIQDLEILLTKKNNFASGGTEGLPITALTTTFSIYEDISTFNNSCDLLINDATGIIERFPIIGEEFLIFRYRSNYNGSNYLNKENLTDGKDNFDLVTRVFKVYKISKQIEKGERNTAFVLHGVENTQILNENTNVEKRTTTIATKAIEDIFNQNFKNPESFQSYVPGPTQKSKQIYGIGQNKINHEKCKNTISYLPPGNTAYEAIKYLLHEAEHSDSAMNNSSDYVFYQTRFGFHLTTVTELKQQREFKIYYVGDQGDGQETTNIVGNSKREPGDKEIILHYQFVNQIDVLKNLKNGLYKNRSVGLDLLTKRINDTSFTYTNDFNTIQLINQGQRFITKNNEFFNVDKLSSTSTRYFTTELKQSTLVTRSNTTNGNYDETPYIKDKIDPIKKDPTRSKELENFDFFVTNPRTKQNFLPRKVGSINVLDNIRLRVTVPGNSEIKVGDLVYLFIPQKGRGEDEPVYNLFFGQKEPKFLITSVRQTYNSEELLYTTIFDVVSDSYAMDLYQLSADEKEIRKKQSEQGPVMGKGKGNLDGGLGSLSGTSSFMSGGR